MKKTKQIKHWSVGGPAVCKLSPPQIKFLKTKEGEKLLSEYGLHLVKNAVINYNEGGVRPGVVLADKNKKLRQFDLSGFWSEVKIGTGRKL